MHPDLNRFNKLIEICGHVEDGSCQGIKIFQDDATYDWIIEVADKRTYFGDNFRATIDAAILGECAE